VEASGKIIF
jgi:tRNA (cytidine/uridine-2'-O-)-methyltransferase